MSPPGADPSSSGRDRIAAIVLAAGTSSRYRRADPALPTKLVAELGGVPLVRLVVAAALASRARPIIVVTGHADAQVRQALSGLEVRCIHNAAFAAGLSGSLKTGLAAVPADRDGTLVLLGDMPGISPALLDRLGAAFAAAPDVDAVVPVHGGRRGNPALLGRGLFGQVEKLTADEGARRLLAEASVLEVEIGDASVSVDIDDPEALRLARRDREMRAPTGETRTRP